MGRLIVDGEPVAGLTLEIVQQDRSMGNLVTPQQTTTAENGTFRLDFLPPTTEFIIYSPIGQSTDAALPVTLLTTPQSGLLADLGDVATEPARQITVKLVTLDGQSIPTGARCYLKQKHASSPDFKTLAPADRETLTFQGVAPEVVELAVLVPGYEVIQSDPFCQVDMNRRLNLNVVNDQTLTIALKKSR